MRKILTKRSACLCSWRNTTAFGLHNHSQIVPLHTIFKNKIILCVSWIKKKTGVIKSQWKNLLIVQSDTLFHKKQVPKNYKVTTTIEIDGGGL